MTSYRIEIARPAQKQVAALDGSVRSRVIDAIRDLAADPHPPGSIKMTGREAWRIRVGNYRVIYEIHDAVLLVNVVEVGHRREVYR